MTYFTSKVYVLCCHFTTSGTLHYTLSDHLSAYTHRGITELTKEHKHETICNLTNFSKESFSKALKPINWSILKRLPLNDAVTYYSPAFLNTLAPQCTKIIKNSHTPRLTNRCKVLMKGRGKALITGKRIKIKNKMATIQTTTKLKQETS